MKLTDALDSIARVAAVGGFGLLFVWLGLAVLGRSTDLDRRLAYWETTRRCFAAGWILLWFGTALGAISWLSR